MVQIHKKCAEFLQSILVPDLNRKHQKVSNVMSLHNETRPSKRSFVVTWRFEDRRLRQSWGIWSKDMLQNDLYNWNSD